MSEETLLCRAGINSAGPQRGTVRVPASAYTRFWRLDDEFFGYAALVRHIIENSMLNGEMIRLDGVLRMAAK